MELQALLNVIQTKQKECQDKKREIIRKMNTKRMLLDESKEILETNLKQSLKQDLKKKNKIERSLRTGDVYETMSNTQAVQLYDCVGWNINNQRIWIQAKINIPGVKSAYLACLPKTDLPETVCFNTQATHLFIGFEHRSIKHENILVYCVYQTSDSVTCSSAPVKVSKWYNQQNTSWFDQSFALSNHLLNLYFPFSTCVEHDCEDINLSSFKQLKEGKAFLSTDHSLFVHIQTKTIIYIYGLDEYKVASFVSDLYQQQSTTTTIKIIHSSFNMADIVKLLGKQAAHTALSIALSQQQ